MFCNRWIFLTFGHKNDCVWLTQNVKNIHFSRSLLITEQMTGSQRCSKHYYQFKKLLYLSCQNTGFTFHPKIRIYYIRYHTVLRRIHNPVGLSLYIILHVYPVWRISLRPFRSYKLYSRLLQPDILINFLIA